MKRFLTSVLVIGIVCLGLTAGPCADAVMGEDQCENQR
jgi:hypothetical protein